MNENEQEMNTEMADFNMELDENVQAAIEEFEALYGDSEYEEAEHDLPDNPQNENTMDGYYETGTSYVEENSSGMEPPAYAVEEPPVYYTAPLADDSKGKRDIFLKVGMCVAGVALVVGICFGVGKIVKSFRDSDKDEAVEVAKIEPTKATTTEEATTEEVRWFEEKEVCVPKMTESTKSLPAGDLSVFEMAQEDPDSGIDPWANVTLNLESVEGSINYTSPGEPANTTQLTSTYMVLVDVDSGEIVAERECEKQIVPASMTKILTVLTARDYVDESKLDDTFVITEDIVREAQASGLSAVGFLPGQEVTVRDMLYGTIVCSGADAAMGLARYCAGSEEEFVARMNENVEMLGLSDTAHFTNVVGTYDENLYCTMTDMASILSVAIQDDLLLDVLSTRIYTTDTKYELKDESEEEGQEEESLENEDSSSEETEESTEEKEMVPFQLSNWFLRRIEDKEMLGNVIGAKTGFVNQSGFCAASYYEADNGKRYICVTGNSFSSWRTIYDHVSVYRSLT